MSGLDAFTQVPTHTLVPVDEPQADESPKTAKLAPSGVLRRLAAHALDLAVVSGAGSLTYLASGSPLLAGVVAGEIALGLWVWEARSGRTIGKSLLSVRAAQSDRDYAPGLARGAARGALLGLSHVLVPIGQFLLIATSALDHSGRGQAWHDRLAKTRVVDVRPKSARRAPVQQYAPPAVGTPAVPPDPGYREIPHIGPPVGEPVALAPPPGAPVGHQFVAPPPQYGGPHAPPSDWYRPTAEPQRPVLPPEEALPVPASVSEETMTGESFYVLGIDDGQSVTITGAGLIGRRPQAAPGESVDHLVAIDDPGRSLSRTHAEFGVDGDMLWVQDRGSANGTVIATDDGSRTRALPGKRVYVPEGARIELGDRTVTVERWQS